MAVDDGGCDRRAGADRVDLCGEADMRIANRCEICLLLADARGYAGAPVLAQRQ